MRSRGLILAASTLAIALSLSACSGDGDDDKGKTDAAAPSESSNAGEKVFHKKCDAELELSGAVLWTWSGKGTVTNEGGVTTYQAADGEDSVIVYAGNDNITTNANVTYDGQTYTTTDPESGLDVAANGTSAKVNAPTTGVAGDGPRAVIKFTCGKAGSGKS